MSFGLQHLKDQAFLVGGCRALSLLLLGAGTVAWSSPRAEIGEAWADCSQGSRNLVFPFFLAYYCKD